MKNNNHAVEDATSNPVRPSNQIHVLTLAAIGFLAYYLTAMWHENLGHGLAFYLVGARHFVLTPTSMTSPDVPITGPGITLAGRFVLAAGSLSNFILSAMLYPVFRYTVRIRANIILRLFLWLAVSLNFYLGAVYIASSPILGFGDFSAVLAFLPHQDLGRIIEVVIGTILSVAAVRFFAGSFAEFPENLWRTALVPYFSATLIFCVAGLRTPNSSLLLFSVIPAALIGQSILLFVTPLARKLRTVPAPPPSARECGVSPTAIIFGLVFVIIIFVTAPGIHFTLR